MARAKPPNSYTFRFTVDALCVLFVTKLGFGLTGALGDPLLPTLASYAQDAGLILLGAALLALLERVVSRLRPLSRCLTVAWVFLLTAMSLAYTPLIPNLLQQPVNVFSLDPALITFSAGIFVSPLLLLSAAALCALLFGLPLVFPSRLRPRSAVVKGLCVLHAVLFLASLARPAVSPLAYSALDEGATLVRRIRNPYGIRKLRSMPTAARDGDYGFLFRMPAPVTTHSPRYDRILVLVMESVDYDAFVAHFRSPGARFLRRVKEHALLYTNYHCLNLESYTGLMTLTGSVFIPYRAYGDDTPFRFVNGRDNLVRQMKTGGYSPWFVSSYGAWQARFVPSGPDWDGILLKDPARSPQFIAVDTTAIERAMEDRAVLDDVMELCRRPGKLFLLQEMVAGHAPVWTERTGIEPLVYYDRYFTELYDRLEREGLLKGTLLVITSDHGPRPAPFDPVSYHLPLLLVAPDLAPAEEGAFLSHLDFAAIVKARAGLGGPAEPANRIFVVGSSVDFVYGMLDRDGHYALIDDHAFRVRTDLPPERVRAFQREFEGYRDFFEAERGSSAPWPHAPLPIHLVVR